MNRGTLRRAAILIASLDTDSADALLEQMPPDDALMVRNAVMDLGDIDIVEQQEVMQQFVAHSPQSQDVPDDGVELDPELAKRLADTDATISEPASGSNEALLNPPTTPAARPFSCLTDVNAEELAMLLAHEHPQTTAILVAHLEPIHAAEVLAFLDRERQSDTLARIARLQPTHLDVVRVLEEELLARLACKSGREPIDSAGLATVEAILQSTSGGLRRELEVQLSKHDHQLLEQLQTCSPLRPSATAAPGLENPLTSNADWHDDDSPASDAVASATLDASAESSQILFEFNDLEHLDDSLLAEVLRRSPSETTLLALAGASATFVKRIQSQLSRREAILLQRKVEQIGPLRLDDVLRAQRYLADLAQQVVEERSLPVPKKQRLSLAA